MKESVFFTLVGRSAKGERRVLVGDWTWSGHTSETSLQLRVGVSAAAAVDKLQTAHTLLVVEPHGQPKHSAGAACLQGFGTMLWRGINRFIMQFSVEHPDCTPPPNNCSFLFRLCFWLPSLKCHSIGPIHTRRARATEANGTCCRQWACSHCTQATSKDLHSNFCARCVPHPVWMRS